MHVREQIHVFAELGIIAEKIAGLQNRIGADFHALADGAMRANVRGRINLRGGGDDRRRVDSSGEFLFGKEEREGLCKRDASVRHADQDFFCGRKAFVGDDGGGGALLGAGEIILIFREGDVAGLRTFGRREVFKDGIGIANYFATNEFCDFCG